MLRSCTHGQTRQGFKYHAPRLCMTVLAALLSGCNWVSTPSVSTAGEPANGDSGMPSLSADGRVVAFVSTATNLDPKHPVIGADPLQVYVHDALLGTTALISADALGHAGNAYSYNPQVSGNGRYVAYQSLANDLVPDDDNSVYDIFIYDRKLRRNQRISPTVRDGMEAVFNSAPSISRTGRYVAYFSQVRSGAGPRYYLDSSIVVHDRHTGTTSRIQVPGEDSHKRYVSMNPSVSDDGRFVAFDSGDDVASVPRQVIVYDQQTGSSEIVSRSSEGVAANASSVVPAISADGRFVAFMSRADNLVAGDNNGAVDVFVHDRITHTTERVSVDSAGNEANGYSSYPDISGDGRYVAFISAASNLVADDGNGVVDAFVRDCKNGTTRRASLDATGSEANAETYEYPVMSADGRYVGLSSAASNLIASDDNGVLDVVLRAVPQVTVTSVVPDHLPIGATTSVTVTGSDFLAGAQPLLGAWVSNVVIVDEHTLTMDVTVPAHMPAGARTLVVSLPGTGPGVLRGAVGKCQDCVTFF